MVMWETLGEVVGELGKVNPDLSGDGIGLLTSAFGRMRYVYL